MGDFSVILTFSTGYAIRAQKVLAESGIESKLIPVPRRLSSDCGVSVRIRRTDGTSAEEVLKEKGILFDRIVPL